MESEMPPTTPDYAAARLQGHAEVRARMEHQGPSRAMSLLSLWEAVAMVGFMGTFLISFGGRPLDDAATGSVPYSIWMPAFPLVVLGPLVNGARERFSIRKKRTPAFWIAYGLIFAAFLYLLMGSVDHPWWVNLLVPGILFVTMATSPILQLRSAGTPNSQRWSNEPLSRSTRWTTVLIGLAMGLVVLVAAAQAWLPDVSLVIILPLIVVVLFSRRLLRAGYEWGTIHWGAFGITTGLLFVLTVLLSLTNWFTAPIIIGAGALVLLIMLVAAFLPLTSSAG